MTYSDYMPPVGGDKTNYFPLDVECVDATGNRFTSHDFTPDGLGPNCRRCGAEADDAEES
ncbi:hypothetical protein ABZ553_14930 [Streptomyces sparsogenes]|uniref:hypothetical protein n=1 Tax=Streptomyces sparsogenes TaxID=67365 RepID=UPI0033D0AE0C